MRESVLVQNDNETSFLEIDIDSISLEELVRSYSNAHEILQNGCNNQQEIRTKMITILQEIQNRGNQSLQEKISAYTKAKKLREEIDATLNKIYGEGNPDLLSVPEWNMLHFPSPEKVWEGIPIEILRTVATFHGLIGSTPNWHRIHHADFPGTLSLMIPFQEAFENLQRVKIITPDNLSDFCFVTE